MGERTEISWTDHTFNPWWGCTQVSPGCDRCYAKTFDRRVHGRDGAHWGNARSRRFFGDHHWNQPLRWNRLAEAARIRRRVFCASMADVGEDRPELIEHRARLVLTIQNTPWLDWLLLSKRPENYLRLFGEYWPDEWPRNVWAGCTTENQEMADERIPELLRVPAAVRFLSCEPLLGPVEFSDVSRRSDAVMVLGQRALSGIHWVICGGESGHGARPMHPDWARSLRDQCKAAGVAFHFKQWGEWTPLEPTAQPPFWAAPDGAEVDAHMFPEHLSDGEPVHGWWAPDADAVVYRQLGKKASGRLLGGRTWDELPTAVVP